MDGSVSRNLAELRQTFRSGKTKGVAWQKAQLQAVLKLLEENESQIFEALQLDLGKHPVEAYRDEFGVVKKSATDALRNINKWMAPKMEAGYPATGTIVHLVLYIKMHAAGQACTPFSQAHLPLLLFPSKAKILPEPLGTVLIFGSWNFPITLTLDPLIGAISAGNTVVLKPSDLSPACSSFLYRTIPLYLDSKAIKVVEGGSDVAEQLLQQQWDKIFFTGSPRVGSIVMAAAAKHLTPVTLELGGKCPLILDSLSGSQLKVAVMRIASGKWAPCAGQACIAVDYVLVHQKVAQSLVDLLRNCIKKFHGDDVKNLQSICRIVNKHHFDRVCSLLEEPRVADSIVYGGSIDKRKMMIEPTILLNPPLDSRIMTEEIFGPLLPIITLDDIEESINFINQRPKPLVIYAFTKTLKLQDKILQETSSGSVTFNDTLIQFLLDVLPFGGAVKVVSGDTTGSTHSIILATRNPSYIEASSPSWSQGTLHGMILSWSS